ncbi:hypothetical protein AB205_0072910 [Aquarana catesbeiana]|uniref:Immunoglobulin domain-containing protein n=1 Tax=Aquarana catesbeiana TaxID=8400 RepID=A0A2G9S0F5_AQUCT|nr:hypothetical protein AB205_0072910 [Aquarana catesbeiana]
MKNLRDWGQARATVLLLILCLLQLIPHIAEGEFGEESRVGAPPGWGSREESDMCGHWRGDVRIKPESPSWSRLTEPCKVHLRGGKGIMLLIPDPIINATVTQNVLLSVDYTCNGTSWIQWQFMSSWKSQCIIEWKTNSYINISSSYNGRVHNYDNGSIQLLNVEVRDSGFYMITLSDEIGNIKQSTIILNVHEVRYEELYFVAVFIAFLAAGSAVLVCLMWVCNKCINICQKRKQHRRGNAVLY